MKKGTLTRLASPPTLLSSTAFRAVVEEFVIRDGTDHSPIERRIETVMWQLDVVLVELHFDEERNLPHPSGARKAACG